MPALEQASNPHTRRAPSIGYHHPATDTEYHMILAALNPNRRLLAGAVCSLLALAGITTLWPGHDQMPPREAHRG